MTVLAFDVNRALPPRRAFFLLCGLNCIRLIGALPQYMPRLQRQLHGLGYAAAVVAEQLTACHPLCRAAI